MFSATTIQPTGAAAISTTPARQVRPSRTWPQLAYRVARRAAGLRLIQVWACDLNAISEPRWDNPYEFREFDADELARLAADPASDLTADVVAQLTAAGHRCFGTVHGRNLAGYVWCAVRDISREHTLDVPLTLPGDACYVFKAFTVPAYRGRRIHNITLKRVLVELSRLGKTRGIAIIEYGNVASMRSHDRVGMKPQGWIATLGPGRFAWRWYAQAARQCGFGG